MGLNFEEKIYHYVMEEIRMKIRKEGEKVIIYKFSYYEEENNILYLFNNKNQIYRITVDSIDLVDNGTDGVLFLLNGQYKTFRACRCG